MIASLMVLVANTLFLQLVAGDANFTCTPNTYFPHPSDCSLYYHCDNENIQQLFYCPIDSYYNPLSQSCDLPRTGECPVPQSESEDDNGGGAVKTFALAPEVDQKVDEDVKEGDVSKSNENQEDDGAKDVWKPIPSDNVAEEPSGNPATSNKFFYALRNFGKTLEDAVTNGQESEEDATIFPEKVRRQRSENETSSPSIILEAIGRDQIVEAQETNATGETQEKVSTEGKCNADSFTVKSLPTFPIVGVLLGKKGDEAKPSEATPETKEVPTETKEESSGDGEVVDESENQKPEDSSSNVDNSTLSSPPNVTFTRNAPLQDPQVVPDLTKITNTEVETLNFTSNDDALITIPDFTFLNPKDALTPLGPSSGEQIGTVKNLPVEIITGDETGNFEGSDKVAEIEEAKSTLIFESHPEPVQESESKPDEYTKVIINESVRVK